VPLRQGPLVPEVIAWGIENRALQRVTTAAILIQARAAGTELQP